jgi:hypothetical protein
LHFRKPGGRGATGDAHEFIGIGVLERIE